MNSTLQIIGHGHALGSVVKANEETAAAIGLEKSWFYDHTGISHRRECGPDEDVMTLGLAAVKAALMDAGLDIGQIEEDTVLLHIKNGFMDFTPPPGILLAAQLGAKSLRSLTIDGACSEPVNMLEMAHYMLQAGRCKYVIISAAVDFMKAVDPKDRVTAGLFGAGAGALIVQNGPDPKDNSRLTGLHWISKPEFWNLGVVPLKSFQKDKDCLRLNVGFYEMKGSRLAKVALQVLPIVIGGALGQADWKLEDIDLIICHQPNAKLLEIGMKKLGLNPARVYCPVATIGNLGPASLLSSFSMARKADLFKRGDKILMISFGLGFSCGAAALVY